MAVRFLVWAVFAAILAPTTQGHRNVTEEEQLMDHLFSNYSRHVRPSITHNHTLNMTFGIAYVQLVELDDREMTLISNVWIRQNW